MAANTASGMCSTIGPMKTITANRKPATVSPAMIVRPPLKMLTNVAELAAPDNPPNAAATMLPKPEAEHRSI